MNQLSHPYMTTGKATVLTIQKFVSKVMSLLINVLSRFFTVFLPWSKHLLISWLQSLSTLILEPKKIKSVTASTFSPSICHKVLDLDSMILVFWMLSCKSDFSLSSFTLSKRLFSSPLLSAVKVASSDIWGYWYFSRMSVFTTMLVMWESPNLDLIASYNEVNSSSKFLWNVIAGFLFWWLSL